MTNIQKILIRIPRTGINTIVVESLPNGVPALVSKNPDETYTIVLNNMYAHERLKAEFLHELKHIVESHHNLPTADAAEKKVRATENVGFTPISKLPYHLIRLLTHEYYNQNPKQKESRELTEADYYPPGAYEEMKRKKWI